ncbi:MAG: cysteine peptidase family C39 domain-containing protein [Planctomycetota bacterium]
MTQHPSDAFERQTYPYDCGIAVIRTLLKHFGMPVPKRIDLRLTAGTDTTGTSVDGMIKACDAVGLRIKVHRVGPHESIEQGMTPAIALTQRPNGQGHFEALLAVDGDKLDVADPASGRRWTAREEFRSRWTGTLLSVRIAQSGGLEFPSLDRESHYVSKAWALAGMAPMSVYPLIVCSLGKLTLLFLRIALLHHVLVLLARLNGGLELLDRQQLLSLLAGIVIAWIGSMLFHLRGIGIAQATKQGIEFRIQAALLKAMMTPARLGHGKAELTQAFQTDAPGAAQGIVAFISIAVRCITLLSLLALTALICRPAGAVLLISIPVLGLTGFWMEKSIRLSGQEASIAGRAISARLGRMLEARPALALDHSLAMVADQLSTEHDAIKLAQVRLSGKKQAAENINRLSCAAVGMLTIGVSVWAALEGSLWTGKIVILFLLVYHFIELLKGMTSEVRKTEKLRCRIDRLTDLLDEPSFDSGYQSADIKKLISLKSVDADRLRGRKPLDLTIPAKTFTMIVDRTGVRASVVRDLISMRMRMTGGVIEIDGVRCASLQDAFPSRYVSLIFDRAVVQPASVLENIRVGFQGVSHDDAVAASKKVGLHSMVCRLPHGYSHVLDPSDPKTFQIRRKLSLARAILKDASLIIIDALSAWKDERQRELELSLIQEHWPGKTVVALVRTPKHAPSFSCINLEES